MHRQVCVGGRGDCRRQYIGMLMSGLEERFRCGAGQVVGMECG